MKKLIFILYKKKEKEDTFNYIFENLLTYIKITLKNIINDIIGTEYIKTKDMKNVAQYILQDKDQCDITTKYVNEYINSNEKMNSIKENIDKVIVNNCNNAYTICKLLSKNMTLQKLTDIATKLHMNTDELQEIFVHCLLMNSSHVYLHKNDIMKEYKNIKNLMNFYIVII